MTADEQLKTAVARAWDAGAPSYDATPRHGLRFDDEWVAWRRLVAAILGDPSHSDVARLRVLDVGTGTGVLALLAAELGHDVTGVDLSPGMLAVARRRAAEAGLAVDLRVADAEALPAGLVGFDAVLSRHLLWTLPHPDRAIAAWRDAARPGGLVAIIDGTQRPGPLPVAAARRLASAIVERRRPRDPGHAYDEATSHALPLHGLRDTARVEALLRGAGLEHVRVRDLPEVDRVELGHLPPLQRFADDWRRYLATGRTPRIVAGADTVAVAAAHPDTATPGAAAPAPGEPAPG